MTPNKKITNQATDEKALAAIQRHTEKLQELYLKIKNIVNSYDDSDAVVESGKLLPKSWKKLEAIADKLFQRKVKYVDASELNSHSNDNTDHSVYEALTSIKDGFADDVMRFATDDDSHTYINQAWGSNEAFNETKKYFDEDEFYTVHGQLTHLAGITQPVMHQLGLVHEEFDKLKLHCNRLAQAYDYQIKVIQAIRSFIETQGDIGIEKGGALISVRTSNDYAIDMGSPETSLVQQILDHLTSKDLFDPAIHHHIIQASRGLDFTDKTLIHDRRTFAAHFEALEHNLTTNKTALESIIKIADRARSAVNQQVIDTCNLFDKAV